MQLFKKKEINMLEGPVLSQIISFGVPIFLGSIFQMMYNMVDSIVVGKYISANALAAVGSTSTVSMLLVGLLTGFPTGAAVVAAQLLGAGEVKKIKATISTTFWFILGLAMILMSFGLLMAEQIMTWVNVPKEILDDTILYFRIYMAGVLFMALYNFFAGFLRALGDSTTPLIFLIISSVLNIAGDLFFVLALGRGVDGVAWATTISQFISVVLCVIYVYIRSPYFHFTKGEFVFDRVLFKDILRLGIPSGLQSSITGFGMIMVQSLINSFGAVSMAAYTAASKMEQICNLPMNSIGISLSMFVGQNIGAGNIKRSKKGLSRAVILSVGLSAFMSLIIFLFGKYLMMLFVKESDVQVIEVGNEFMRNWALLVFVHGIFDCVVAFLRGSGDSVYAMFSMFFDLITRTIMAYLLAKGMKLGFVGISYAIPCGWICCTIFSTVRFLTGGWKKKAVVKTKTEEG